MAEIIIPVKNIEEELTGSHAHLYVIIVFFMSSSNSLLRVLEETQSCPRVRLGPHRLGGRGGDVSRYLFNKDKKYVIQRIKAARRMVT